MKLPESVRPRARVISVLLAVFLGWAAGGGAADPGGGAQAEGIKVHGHWTIDVRNPDGKLVSHHETENALAPGGGGYSGGAGLLAGLLGHFWTDPIWEIYLSGSPTNPCTYADNPAAIPCVIVEARHPSASQPNISSRDLTLGIQEVGGIPAGTLVLSGSVTVVNDSAINLVQSSFRVTQTSSGHAGFGGSFTDKQIAVPIPVHQGQIVQVKVVFSFS